MSETNRLILGLFVWIFLMLGIIWVRVTTALDRIEAEVKALARIEIKLDAIAKRQ